MNQNRCSGCCSLAYPRFARFGNQRIGQVDDRLSVATVASQYRSTYTGTKSSYDVSTNVGTIRADTGMVGDADRTGAGHCT